MRFLTIDPGKKIVGWAVFERVPGQSFTRLSDCGLLRAETPREMLIQSDRAGIRDIEWAEVIVECPQAYSQRERQKGPQQDLIDIAIMGGLVAGFAVSNMPVITFVHPHAWKGSVEKDAMSRRILKRLDPDEVTIVDRLRPASLVHNAVDAVGIGLWKLGRL